MGQKYQNAIDLICIDPPYGVLQKDRDHTLSAFNMEEIAKIIHHFLQPNGTFFIFCASQQIVSWENAINSAGGGLKVISNSFNIILDPSGYFIFLFCS